MTAARFLIAAMLIGASGFPLHAARSHEPVVADPNLQRQDAAAGPLPETAPIQGAVLQETVTVVADQPIPSLPGKRLVSLLVDYPPGAASGPHRHAPSAFIYAFVVSGEILSQVDAGTARVYGPGESWVEHPGAHHVVSANASDAKPARLLAVFILDATDEQITIPDVQ